MTQPPPATPRKYVADIHDGKETILEGTADYAYWRDRLAPAGLTPQRIDGRAALLLSATELRWMGIRFNEMSILVALCESADCAESTGYYLIHAFNSVPLLAWFERTLFRTPYSAARMDVRESLPAHFAVERDGQTLMRAAMADRPTPAAPQPDVWEGPVYVPTPSGAPGRTHFFVHLSGPTTAYPFLPSDEFTLSSGDLPPVLQALRDSDFRGTHWRLRSRARHAKAATVRA